jgi:hypothetical protein
MICGSIRKPARKIEKPPSSGPGGRTLAKAKPDKGEKPGTEEAAASGDIVATKPKKPARKKAVAASAAPVDGGVAAEAAKAIQPKPAERPWLKS